jgi:tetratricopeptide (TPR) repeat protein
VLEAAFVYAQHADATLELAARFDAARAGGDAWPAVGATARRLLLSVGPATGRWGKLALPWTDPPEDGTDWAFETRVLMAAEPAIPLPRPRIVALRDSLRARRPYRLLMALTYSDAAALSGAELQRYLDGLLSVRLGEYQPAEQAAGELAAAGADGRRRPAAMLAHALRAEIAHAAGDDRHALAELDHFELAPTRWTTLPTHWGTRARFLRAEILLALGREEEAADFYDSIFTAFDAAYLALAHLRRAQIHARRREGDAARFHYGRFVSLWEACDPEFRPLLEQARRELAALGPAPQ